MSFFAQRVFAAGPTGLNQDFNTLLGRVVTEVIYPVIGLAFAVAMIYFLWGVFKFIKNADNSEERVTGGRHMLWGVIGMAIMVSAYALVLFIDSSIHHI